MQIYTNKSFRRVLEGNSAGSLFPDRTATLVVEHCTFAVNVARTPGTAIADSVEITLNLPWTEGFVQTENLLSVTSSSTACASLLGVSYTDNVYLSSISGTGIDESH